VGLFSLIKKIKRNAQTFNKNIPLYKLKAESYELPTPAFLYISIFLQIKEGDNDDEKIR